MRTRLLFALPLLACAEPEPPPKVLQSEGGTCAASEDCANGLHCSARKCTPPANDEEARAVTIIKLERKIADTHEHEAKAFTEDGKRRMRAERAKLEEKLAAARAE